MSIVFDLDGTIADTAEDLIDAAAAALVAEGFPKPNAQAIREHVGYGAAAMIRSALAASGKHAEEWQLKRLTDHLLAHYNENIANKTRFFPGFRDVAEQLRTHGAKLMICTNKREKLARKLLAALGCEALFDALAGADTFPFRKPDPRHVTELVRLAGAELSKTVMVGDSEADVAAAKAAGVPIIAVRFGYAALPAEQLGADAVVNEFNELPLLLHKFLSAKTCS